MKLKKPEDLTKEELIKEIRIRDKVIKIYSKQFIVLEELLKIPRGIY